MIAVAATLLLLLGALVAPHASQATGGRCADWSAARRPLFGDLHVHTGLSMDAGTQGTRTTPDQAYAFARGEALGLHPFGKDGRPLRQVQLERPLDFAAVTDHAELLGEVEICRDPEREGHDAVLCRVYRRWPRIGFFTFSGPKQRFSFCGEDGERCLEAARTPWKVIRDAAEAAYERSPACRFTSLVGYEYTKSGGLGENLHRNVIFANATVPELPASALDARTPEALYAALERDCRRGLPGCRVLSIPHNSNLSGGEMFPFTRADGSPMTRAEALERVRNEPLVEIVQHKGDSECGPQAVASDELCAFEKLPYATFGERFVAAMRTEPSRLSFVRHAQAEGLVQQTKIGANAYRVGVIGSTDTHLGTPGLVDEVDYPGHGGAGLHIGDTLPDSLLDPIEYNPGGLAGVWAEENSRTAIYDALERREVWGTSGPRIAPRFFGGWNLDPSMCDSHRFAEQGYASGVPMGGELAEAPGADAAPTKAPTLAVWAARDPGTATRPGTPLQRLQIVKAWVENGSAREAVFDVAGDGGNGASVDRGTCEPRGAGFDALCSVWRDPDFDPASPALYYARIVENPTCRWSAYACLQRGIDCSETADVPRGYLACCDTTVPRTTQERAWTSPIWYTPRTTVGYTP